jgi:aspartate/methionine/tyrosine aminotransferase
MVHRSRRVPEDLSPNRLAEARARLGGVPFDLTVSNPTQCDLPYPSGLLEPLADPRGLRYEADPRGPMVARLAVAEELRTQGAEVDPRHIFLTASTSEAYSFLFRLFCDPGDGVLVPAPSYPLLDHLARLDGIEAPAYSLDPETKWRIDFSTFEGLSVPIRAVVVVHPNNPTGSFIHPEDRERLLSLCRERSWALIADEVFLPYPIEGGPGSDSSFSSVEDCLCCTLGGLSKSVGLPQLKLSWIAVSGPDEGVDRVLDGLDYVADAYLSVSTPVALAAPELLADAAPLRDAIADRCRANLAVLRRLASEHPAARVGPVGGGWSAVLQIPSVVGEEELCLKLLVEKGVAVYPGSPFGFARDGWLVLSLLPPEEVFSAATDRLFAALAEVLRPRSGSAGG